MERLSQRHCARTSQLLESNVVVTVVAVTAQVSLYNSFTQLTVFCLILVFFYSTIPNRRGKKTSTTTNKRKAYESSSSEYFNSRDVFQPNSVQETNPTAKNKASTTSTLPGVISYLSQWVCFLSLRNTSSYYPCCSPSGCINITWTDLQLWLLWRLHWWKRW